MWHCRDYFRDNRLKMTKEEYDKRAAELGLSKPGERTCKNGPNGSPCDRCVKDGPWDEGQCRSCWLFWNDPVYRNGWHGTPLPVDHKVPQQPSPTAIPIQDGPSWFRQVVNYTGAVVKHVWNGLPESPSDLQEKRISICLTCPGKFINLETGRCSHKKCGCGIINKTRWRDQTCPEGYW